MSQQSVNTACVHAGTLVDERTKGVNTPIYTSTSFAYLDLEEAVYPRYFNVPNTLALNSKISMLEHGEAGLVFSSGMAAISSTLLAFLKNGDHAVFQKGLYGGTFVMVTRELNKYGIDYDITPDNDISSFEKLIKSNTKIIFIETPSNPLLSIVDITIVSELAKSRGLISVIDNTFASPVNQNPIDLGIDIVLHSATKYLGGHSDICAGAAISTKKYIKNIRTTALSLGGSLNAQTCYLLERSIKTLGIRVERQNQNAQKVAEFLKSHPGTEQVYYPGLRDHPGHVIAARQMSGFGGMLSFELLFADPVKFQKKLKLIRPSVSLGGVDTIICSPVMTSHRHLSKEEMEKEGIRNNLLRLSVGIEDVKDIIEDLEQAF
ncbi:MAG: cystathionine beta-lyase [Bacteroides sp. SM23_62_1]|nr:MAG: cystathionine beta-lyase [Bacteroides sp. SM23_62_1]